MKNKKGFLLAEETLKLVVAVIALGFLVYLLVALYLSTNKSQELEQAKSSLNFLVSEINSGKERVDIYNPKGWWIGAWPHNFKATDPLNPNKIERRLPGSCSNLGWENCICICEEDNADSCDKKWVCLDNAQKFETVGELRLLPGGTEVFQEESIQIKNPPITLNIDQTNKKISLVTEQAGGGGGF
ncbi:MAG: hypothetical protein AABX79_02935 [Nanoarchaeota archaeon]